jgi:hypothetical protein
VAKETQRCIDYKKELIEHHQELCMKGMKQLKDIRARMGKGQRSKAIQTISNKETSRKDWQQIRQIMKPQERSNLNTIKIPLQDENGELTDDPDKAVTWYWIMDPTLIEDKLLERNVKHFGQAEGTLFSTQHFQELFKYEGISPAVECSWKDDSKSTLHQIWTPDHVHY